MTKGDKKVFSHNESKLKEMLNLRRTGYALTTLATMYDCHHYTSIKFQCDKYKVKPMGDTYTLERIMDRLLLSL